MPPHAKSPATFYQYSYDNIGQLQTAQGWESDTVTPRLQEQFGYAYDAAWNLNQRTNNALRQTFNVNALNEQTVINHSGTLTVAGTTTSLATNVTVNTSNAVLYADATFASTNQPIANAAWNSYTAIAKDGYGRKDTNTVSLLIPVHDWCYYDLNGNLTNEWSAAGGSVRQFSYDDENQLTSVWVTNAWRSDFVYDGKMRRRIERDFSWNGSTWTQTNETHFIYDGNVVVQERDANNLPKVTYTRGNDLSGTLQGAGGIGGLLARSDNTQMLIGGASAHAYYHADGNGNVTAMINNLQLLIAKYLYDPYGNLLSMSGWMAPINTYRFSSKEWNENAGLYYYLYRYYDPNLQRWPNRDPIFEWGGFNLYEFVKNNPFSWIDSDGGAPIPCPGMTALINNNNQSGLDPNIIKCIAYRESGFNPTALNRSSSATGLMQMTDGATTDAGGEPSMMGNAGYNIYYGSKYVGMRVRQAHGNITKGLDGYGTGPGYGKAIQDCADCLKQKGNCNGDCLKKAKGQ